MGRGQEALSFTAFLLRRNAEVQEAFANSLLEPSEARLARILFSIRRSKQTGIRGSSPKLSQQTIAEMMGISRQRVNGLIKRFNKVRLPADPGGGSGAQKSREGRFEQAG